MIRLAVVLFLVFELRAQDDLAAAAKSPYRLAAYVNRNAVISWEPLWVALGVEPAALRDCEEARHDRHDCSARVIEIQNPKQAIVVLRHDIEFRKTYLRFMKDGSGWRFSGVVEPFVKYFEIRDWMLSLGGKPFIAITRQGAAGTGMSSEIEDWFDLAEPKFEEPAFSFLRHASDNPIAQGVAREIDGSLVSIGGSPESIRVRWTARLSVSGEPGLHFRPLTGEAVYVRRAGEAKFAFDATLSAISEPEAETLFQGVGDDTFSECDVLKYEFEPLKRVAGSTASSAKDWLRRLLPYCDNTPEKLLLVSLIAGK